MKISSKGRYALAAMICLAQNEIEGSVDTLHAISKRLNLSKLYFEQVFVLLKRAGLVQSVQGAQGGYRLARDPREVSGADILSATETALFEQAAYTVEETEPHIERALRKGVYQPLEKSIMSVLESISLYQLVEEVGTSTGADGYMYNI